MGNSDGDKLGKVIKTKKGKRPAQKNFRRANANGLPFKMGSTLEKPLSYHLSRNLNFKQPYVSSFFAFIGCNAELLIRMPRINLNDRCSHYVYTYILVYFTKPHWIGFFGVAFGNGASFKFKQIDELTPPYKRSCWDWLFDQVLCSKVEQGSSYDFGNMVEDPYNITVPN